MSPIELATPVGQLVAERPARARVFERFGIDYCCGGQTPLRDACAAGGIDPRAVAAALGAADADATATNDADWTTAPLADLIANIVDTHHAYLRRELPRLTQLVAKVYQVHGTRHTELTDVQEVFGDLQAELEAHMMKEERILFPMIETIASSGAHSAAHCGSVQNPIRVMEHEHDSAGAALARLRELTAGYAPPVDACNTYRALLSGLAEFEADLHTHIHKENNILFPRAVELEATRCGSTTTARPVYE
ncbi:MAG TPA: iron-sulfur cluster repair di-iron protein [Phycisphaerae bacterium]|nr:iron-sulfur cluster repair di-iron protein [Phycisphaerae bacterium]